MENLENKIKELETELNKIKESLKAKSNKRKKPKNGEFYWILDSDNIVKDTHWDDDDYDTGYYNNYNCFLTREEAEKAQSVRETENMLRRYIEKHDTVELNWNDEKQCKYLLYYNTIDKEIKIDFWRHFKYPRTIYASNEQVLKDAVKEIGEARIKEYLQY